MTLEQLQKASYFALQQRQKKDPEKFKKEVQQMASRLNKRYHNIKKKGKRELAQNAVRALDESGGSFKTTVKENGKRRKMTDSEILDEAIRERKFTRAKTGTVKGARAARKQQELIFGQSSEEYGKSQQKKYKEKHPEATSKELKKIYKDAKDEYSDLVGDAWDIYHEAQNKDANLQTSDWSKASDVPNLIDSVVHQQVESPYKDPKKMIQEYIDSVRNYMKEADDKKADSPWEVVESYAYS